MPVFLAMVRARGSRAELCVALRQWIQPSGTETSFCFARVFFYSLVLRTGSSESPMIEKTTGRPGVVIRSIVVYTSHGIPTINRPSLFAQPPNSQPDELSSVKKRPPFVLRHSFPNSSLTSNIIHSDSPSTCYPKIRHFGGRHRRRGIRLVRFVIDDFTSFLALPKYPSFVRVVNCKMK